MYDPCGRERQRASFTDKRKPSSQVNECVFSFPAKVASKNNKHGVREGFATLP